jgi:hypothetical protein
MAIPKVTRAHVAWALSKIDKEGIPRKRRSKKWCLVSDGKHYPPKYVLALAVERLSGKQLLPHEHSGGDETNNILRALGYEIVLAPAGSNTREPMGTSRERRPPVIGRLVIDGPPLWRNPAVADLLDVAESILATVLEHWPPDVVADFLVTPGGFLSGQIPKGLSGKRSWASDPRDLPRLAHAATRIVEQVVTPRVGDAAKGKCRYVTLGIDLWSDDNVDAELVALVDLGSLRILRWTGKSYPTSREERSLIQVVDLKSHLLRLGDERILLLGCHDLNMFSPRAWANQSRSSPRRQRCAEMRKMVANFRPTVVLHHPHRTDSPRIWRMPWLYLADQFDIRSWASGICYYNKDGKERATLGAVLSGTRSDGTHALDFVVRTREKSVRLGERVIVA